MHNPWADAVRPHYFLAPDAYGRLVSLVLIRSDWAAGAANRRDRAKKLVVERAAKR